MSRLLVLVAVSLLAMLGLSAGPALAHASTVPAPVTALQKTMTASPAPGGGRAPLAAMAATGKTVAPVRGPALPAGTKQACATPTRIGVEQCMLFLHGNRAASGTQGARAAAAPASGAYGATDLQSAYNLTSASASDGTGTTVAIVDAYGDPNLAGDVATYRAQYGLPACDTSTGDGCVTIVNQNGGTTPPASDPTGGGWAAEQAADAEMVSAICPGCKIVMVEANTPNTGDLGTADNTAAGLAKFVSNSWGGFDYPTDSYQDALYFNHPGVALDFASGDAGYGTGYPASSQLVTSVGGTYLTADSSTTRGWTESVWHNAPASLPQPNGTASGCSAGNGKPSWQTDPGCANRTDNDVSAVASGPEGVSVYSSFNSCAGASTGSWCEGYGTSLSAPIITAVYALAGTPTPGTYPSSYLYESGHAAGLNPVTTGSNGTCEANRLYLCDASHSLSDGYNGPAGWGTPNGVAAFKNSVTSGVVSAYNPGPVDIQTGLDYTRVIQLSATDSTSGQTPTFTLDGGMPPGLTMTSAGLISGTPSGAGSWTVTVTAADGTGAHSTVAFKIGVAPSLESAYHPGTGPVKLDWDSKCLDDANNSASNGSKIQIWTCNGKASQNWAYYPDTDPGDAGEIVINDKCLDIVNQGTGNGAKLQLWGCSGGLNQQWFVVGGDGELYNPVSGKCIDDPYNSTTNGTQVDIWTCNGKAWQAWTLPASPVVSGMAGKCLDDTGGSTANGNKIQLYSCNGLATQKWSIGLDGTIRFGGKCVDAAGYGTTDGTKLQLWSCTGGTNQVWEVTGYGQLENYAAEKCLADPGNTTANGTQLVLEDCYGDQGTVWAET
ncbi:MAG TPA: ricin-type beta-trefoil lectin domain protein [Trebonia sp.]